MLISRNIVQGLFDTDLSPSEEIARGLTMHTFEVEGVKEMGNDEIIDVDVLPNRAHDCLSHFGVAAEIGRVFGLAPNRGFEVVELEEKSREKISIAIEDDLADRFAVALVEGVGGGESPEWLKQALVALGERPISPIVDVLNYVMFLTGQPLHAYDLDALEKTEGEAAFTVRAAKLKESFTSLDGETTELLGGELVIGGKKSVLGLAGVKGGKESAVSEDTIRVALEAATFLPVAVRKSSQSAKIKTNASKRFENDISPELAALGMREALTLLKEIFPNLEVTALRDEYRQKRPMSAIELDPARPSSLIGVDIPADTVERLLKKADCEVEKGAETFIVTPPYERLDLVAPEDLVEEVGRLYGYEHVAPDPLPKHEPERDLSSLRGELNLKYILRDRGYSEVITRAFRNKGEISIENPLAKDEPFLRTDLTTALLSSLEANARNAELLGKSVLRIFEIGTIFTKDGEKKSIALGIYAPKGSGEKISEDSFKVAVEELLSSALGITKDVVLEARINSASKDYSYVLEFDLTSLLEKSESVAHISALDGKEFKTFREFSSFPFVLRDVAVWTPKGTTAEDVEEIIRKSTGDLLLRTRLFDRFEKPSEDGNVRISYAFRLVFQASDRTLSDEEVNRHMAALESAFSTTKGFEIR